MRMMAYSLIFILILAVLAGSVVYVEPIIEFIAGYVAEYYPLAVVIYLFMVVMSVLVAPFNLPIFYVAGNIWGPPLAALYNIIGWSIGAALAFWISRKFGKPFIAKFLSMRRVEAFEKNIPRKLEFFGVVLLRIITPVDISSYALGIFTTMPFRMYMAATVLGITPFAVMFAYAGEAFLAGNYFILSALAVLGAFVAFAAAYFLKTMRERRSGAGANSLAPHDNSESKSDKQESDHEINAE